MEAQHRVAECDAALSTQRAELREAKAGQQARLIAALDARLQAVLAALDASGREVTTWQSGGGALLQDYAAMLKGLTPLPGVCLLPHLPRHGAPSNMATVPCLALAVSECCE